MRMTGSHLTPWRPQLWWWVVPSPCLTFYQLCLGSWGKIQDSSIMPGVTSRRTTPRGIIVNASLYATCPIRPVLEAIGCSSRKDLSRLVSAPTTPDATPEELYTRAYKHMSTTRCPTGTRTHAREHTCHHRQVHRNKTRRATPVWRPRFDRRPHPYRNLP